LLGVRRISPDQRFPPGDLPVVVALGLGRSAKRANQVAEVVEGIGEAATREWLAGVVIGQL
jgi:hypothetical protein